MASAPGRSHSSHHHVPAAGGSPSDCHRSASVVWRIRAMFATKLLLRGVPVALLRSR